MTNQNQRGGKRSGAGRRSLYIFPMRKYTIRIPEETRLSIVKVDDNLSQAIRTIMQDEGVQSSVRELIERKNNHVSN